MVSSFTLLELSFADSEDGVLPEPHPKRDKAIEAARANDKADFRFFIIIYLPFLLVLLIILSYHSHDSVTI